MLHGGRGTIVALLLLTYETVSGASFAGQGPLKGPYLTGLSDSGVDVRFELASPASATVQVTRESPGIPPAPARTFESRQVASMHDVPAVGLESGVAYRYVVRSGSAVVGASPRRRSPAATRR